MKRNYVTTMLYVANAGVMAFWLWVNGSFDFHWDCGQDVPCFLYWWADVLPDIGCAVFAIAALVVFFRLRLGTVLGIVATCLSVPCFGGITLALLFDPRIIHNDSFTWADGIAVSGFAITTAFSIFNLLAMGSSHPVASSSV